MSENKKKYLLPTGFKDCLFDEAEAEFSALVSLMKNFSDAGFRKISAPAIEFVQGDEFESLSKNFKFIDPISKQTVNLRSDITPQISRIATSRLATEKLPLKISYYGDIFSVDHININGDRQLKQVGAELISEDAKAEYDIEILSLAIDSLSKLGLKNLTIDLNTPNLVAALGEDYDAETLAALDKKELAKLPPMLRKLTELCGDSSTAFAVLDEDLPDAAREQIEYIKAVSDGLQKQGADFPANVTIDFVENRSIGNKKKLSFSIFSQNVRGIVGRGGRYKTTDCESSMDATGFSLYLNNFLQALEK